MKMFLRKRYLAGSSHPLLSLSTGNTKKGIHLTLNPSPPAEREERRGARERGMGEGN